MVPAHRTAGTGPGMLLLHGIGSSAASFAPQLKELAGEFTLTAWDAPGYAASPDPVGPVGLDGYVTAAVAVARTALDPGPFHLVGVSWGGAIALRLAATHPELVRSLTVIGASLGSGTDPARAQQMRSRAAELRRLGPQAFARERAPRLLAPDAPAELVETATDTMADAIRLPGYASAAEAMASADLTADLHRITAPTRGRRPAGGPDPAPPPPPAWRPPPAAAPPGATPPPPAPPT
ncbi:alpha/beta fold hydrolase, partial [Streptomyces sp. NPDC059477]|uniref:alpha/beta fold hydrolase n=1 Tax=Streptomyces sp. NPDC059477 TaxID=3346847 RepID=UPI0036801A64